MLITKKCLSRRTLLKGMGVTLALPLLDAMVPALSVAAKTAAKPVRRAAFIYVPHGAVIDKVSHGVDAWTPLGEGSGFEFSQILRPLESFRDRVVVLSGLGHPMAEGMGDGSGEHTRSTAVWLNGVHPRKTEGADVRAGTTVDQVMANVFGKETRLPSLEVAIDSAQRVGNCDVGYSCTYMNTISWRTPTTPNPMENNPRVVFERLFGDGGSPEERSAENQFDRSILDGVSSSVTQLRANVGPADQARLEQYLESIRDIERRIQLAERQGNESPMTLPEEPVGIPDTFQDHIRSLFDLLVLAYQADITRVGSMMVSYESAPRTYPSIGVSEGHHPLSHHNGDTAKVQSLIKINTLHAQMLAYFLEKMRETPAGDGSLLDQSLVLYGSGMGDGNQHNHVNLPCLLAGGAAGRLKGGRHLVYPADTPMTQALVSILDLVGVSADEFGAAGGVTDRLANL